MTSADAPGCACCRPETASRLPDDLPATWERFAVPHDWGLAGLLKRSLEPLFRCPACGTIWRAGYHPYDARYAHLEPLEPALVAALARRADRRGVQAMLAVASAPKALLLAIADATDPAFELSPSLRRRLLRAAGADRDRARPVRPRRR